MLFIIEPAINSTIKLHKHIISTRLSFITLSTRQSVCNNIFFCLLFATHIQNLKIASNRAAVSMSSCLPTNVIIILQPNDYALASLNTVHHHTVIIMLLAFCTWWQLKQNFQMPKPNRPLINKYKFIYALEIWIRSTFHRHCL